MTTETGPTVQPVVKREARPQGGSGSAVYGIGLIGAWVYYIGRAESVQEGALGFLKGFVWPALLVYKALAYLDKE